MQPAPSASVRVEAPDPGLASGRWDVPRGVIAVVGGAILAVGIVYLVVRVVVARARRSTP